MKKETTKKPKKVTIEDVKKAILTELEKKQVSKDWIKSHLIITKL
jgi:hypothetical protein